MAASFKGVKDVLQRVTMPKYIALTRKKLPSALRGGKLIPAQKLIAPGPTTFSDP